MYQLSGVVPANPRLREDRRGDQRARVIFGANQAAVVPAKAGTHNHWGFRLSLPSHIAYCGVWIPVFAGTAESHRFT
jgi:hypothetical protein